MAAILLDTDACLILFDQDGAVPQNGVTVLSAPVIVFTVWIVTKSLLTTNLVNVEKEQHVSPGTPVPR